MKAFVSSLVVVVALCAWTSVAQAQAVRDSMMYEIVQTEPPAGIAPVPSQGFGSSRNVQGVPLTGPFSNIQRFIRRDGTAGRSILGTWASIGTNVAPLLRALLVTDSILAVFRADNSYLTTSYNRAGTETTSFSGAFSTTASASRLGDAPIISIRANQVNPSAVVAQGMYAINPTSTTATSVRGVMRTAQALEQNYPNPVMNGTTIAFRLESASHVDMDIVSVTGKVVRSVMSQRMYAGSHTVHIDASDLAGGTYFVRLSTPEWSEVKTMIIQK